MKLMLTPELSPEGVLHAARVLARRFSPWGALDRDDYVGLACLGFYEARTRWPGVGNFKRYALRWMDGQIREARRRESQQHEDPRPTVQGFASLQTTGVAGGGSASPSPSARHRRLASSSPEAVTLQPALLTLVQHAAGLCACGQPIGRGHGARRCVACAAPPQRPSRAQLRARPAPRPAPAVRLCACGRVMERRQRKRCFACSQSAVAEQKRAAAQRQRAEERARREADPTRQRAAPRQWRCERCGCELTLGRYQYCAACQAVRRARPARTCASCGSILSKHRWKRCVLCQQTVYQLARARRKTA